MKQMIFKMCNGHADIDTAYNMLVLQVVSCDSCLIRAEEKTLLVGSHDQSFCENQEEFLPNEEDDIVKQIQALFSTKGP
jgi:hypothetical protein